MRNRNIPPRLNGDRCNVIVIAISFCLATGYSTTQFLSIHDDCFARLYCYITAIGAIDITIPMINMDVTSSHSIATCMPVAYFAVAMKVRVLTSLCMRLARLKVTMRDRGISG